MSIHLCALEENQKQISNLANRWEIWKHSFWSWCQA